MSEDSATYEIIARSENLGKKKISGGEWDFNIEIAGYCVSPDGSRMAVMLSRGSMASRFPWYEVVGSHLT